MAVPADVSVGSLVYIKDDLNKLRGRERYMVVAIDGSDCTLKKLLKSTLRNQNHKLKLSEVFPVSSNIGTCFLILPKLNKFKKPKLGIFKFGVPNQARRLSYDSMG